MQEPILYADCFLLIPNGAKTDFILELLYPDCSLRAAIIGINPSLPVVTPLTGAIALTTPVDITERQAFDYEISLGALACTKVEPLTGKTLIVLICSIAMSISDFLADTPHRQ